MYGSMYVCATIFDELNEPGGLRCAENFVRMQPYIQLGIPETFFVNHQQLHDKHLLKYMYICVCMYVCMYVCIV